MSKVPSTTLTWFYVAGLKNKCLTHNPYHYYLNLTFHVILLNPIRGINKQKNLVCEINFNIVQIITLYKKSSIWKYFCHISWIITSLKITCKWKIPQTYPTGEMIKFYSFWGVIWYFLHTNLMSPKRTIYSKRWPWLSPIDKITQWNKHKY